MTQLIFIEIGFYALLRNNKKQDVEQNPEWREEKVENNYCFGSNEWWILWEVQKIELTMIVSKL